ncbi:MAG: histidine phosphatase family protein [Acidimicrobiales bacterium]|nr:histidine phosphatase family protein [Acidimicrobiales bacterium]
MTRVLLVRHGQSEWNADGRWQGQADPPLTDLGREQARHAARSLGVVDAIVSSDLQRAADTAALLSNELGVGPLVLDPDLRERDAGEWSGLTRAEIEHGWPGYLDDLGGERRRPPGWEPDDELLARTIASLARIHGLAPDGEAIAVTHGGLVYVLEGHFGEPFARLPNLGGRWLEVGPKGPVRLGERVVLIDPDEVTVPSQI